MAYTILPPTVFEEKIMSFKEQKQKEMQTTQTSSMIAGTLIKRAKHS
ncbi:hypothetical protein [Bartonella birtlesii]|nr:hypothetical protein [Bartonella birtlesii]